MATTAATVEELICELGTASPVYVPARLFPSELVAEAIAAGMVSSWSDSPAGEAVLLSSLAVEALNLELHDPGEIERTRWVRRGLDRPPAAYDCIDLGSLDESGGVRLNRPPGGFDDEPVKRLIGIEELLERLARPREPGAFGDIRPAIVPTPILVHGSTRPGWSPAIEPIGNPSRPGGSACPICRGRAMTPLELCLSCCRSGVDGMLPKVSDHEKPRRGAPGRGGLAGGTGKGKVTGGKGRRATSRRAG